MVKTYPLQAHSKVVSLRQPYAVEDTTLTSTPCHASTICYIYENFILCSVHRHKVHE